MTQITIHIPSRLKAFITTKVKEGFESTESYLLTLIEAEQLQDAQAADVLDDLTKTERARLNAILIERSKGPFETIDPFHENFWDGIKAAGRKRVATALKAHG